MPNNKGFQSLNSSASEFNATDFVVRQILARVNTATLAQVLSVSNAGGVSPVGTVSLQPLVNQVDASGKGWSRGIINNVPYFRLQGGSNAVILDPQVGDIGIVIFCSRDISAVKRSKGKNNPGSARQFDVSDGLYLGGFLNGTPSQYVQFTASGITVNSPTKVTIVAPAIEADASATFTVNAAAITLNGPVTGTSSMTAPNIIGTTDVSFGGKSAIAHKHGGVQTGTGVSGVPV